MASSASVWEALGWRLFFDTRLSGPRTFSCASCHVPEHGFADGLRLAEGVHGDTLTRHTPRLVDLAEAELFFWDGRAESLEAQIRVPITDPREMDLPWEEIAPRVAEDPTYTAVFALLDRQPDAETVVEALAHFVRGLEAGESALDRWLAGQGDALGPAARRGRMLFFTRAQCATCHIGKALTDHDFHNVGSGSEDDPGRSAITGRVEDRGRFKTPPLRGITNSQPFFHDGRFATLAEVVDHYSEPASGAVGESELDPLDLDADEKADLVAFLVALEAPGPDLERHRRRWQQLVTEAEILPWSSALSGETPGNRDDDRWRGDG